MKNKRLFSNWKLGTEKQKELLKRMIDSRNEAAKLGQAYAVQEINYMLAKLAKKLKLDYYSL